MDNVQVWDVNGLAMDEREMSLSELPPVPSYFEEALLEAGGTCDGKPNVRIVSGLDPNIKEFYGGRWWLKYAFREHKTHHYTIWHKPDGSKKILSPKESEILGKQKNIQGILLPVVDEQILEYGIPRYYVEYFRPATYYGTPEAWNLVRYDTDENGNRHDLMGEFPHEGNYETWFCIEEPVIEDGVVVKTKFRELDEIVLEYIKQEIERTKVQSAVARHNLNRKQVDENYVKQKEQLKENIKDIVADRIDRIID